MILKKILSKKKIIVLGITALSIGTILANSKNVSSACSGCAVCTGKCAFLPQPTKVTDYNKKYYLSKQSECLQYFDEYQAKYFNKELMKLYGEKKSKDITSEARKQFINILPNIPYIGGDSNSLTGNLVQCTLMLPYYKVLKSNKVPIEKIGEIVYNSFLNEYKDLSAKEKEDAHNNFFSKKTIDKLKADSKISKKKQYTFDWIFDVKTDNNKVYDFKVEYTQCGVAKFFHTQNADEFTPYMCKLDFIISDAFKEGLKRTGTIAEGKKMCDFMYKNKK